MTGCLSGQAAGKDRRKNAENTIYHKITGGGDRREISDAVSYL